MSSPTRSLFSWLKTNLPSVRTPAMEWKCPPSEERDRKEAALDEAVKFAFATTVTDIRQVGFDPDAFVQNLKIALFGYSTVDGERDSTPVYIETTFADSVENLARDLYNDLPYDGPEGTTKPVWFVNGNSLKQEECREAARRRLLEG